ncbi:hypothetical protein KQI42_20600 [Tissierella sp. MSJ-40]|uniref:Uncharacterized protein n=1 Tax=Tissierella simiarum TaxID=2841534 RepID=A0ABS6EC88_9FIRM|nr:hypothetical protein [Tissierella simiarum]MBU5440397.1 hypothetical protein [Tissierella simiarum]
MEEKRIEISREKLEWMKEVGIKEFHEPMKYYFANHLFSENYIRETPLKKLQEEFNRSVFAHNKFNEDGEV